MTNTLLASWQIYKKTSSSISYFKYVGITSDEILQKDIQNLSIRAKSIFLDIFFSVKNRANNINDENLIDRLIVEIDFSQYARSYKSKILKEFNDINLISKIGKDKYIVNVCYINPYNSEQMKLLVNQMMLADYEFRNF